MNIILLVPKVVNRYVASFPEVTNNAYKYFNYDRPVIEERVFRGDAPSTYRGPDDLQDADYDSLLHFAKGIMDPVLVKYNAGVACEDALSKALRSYGNGMFDNKVNASRYDSLLCAMRQQLGLPISRTLEYRHTAAQIDEMKTAAHKAQPKQKQERKHLKLKPHMIRELELKMRDLPSRSMGQKGPHIVKEKGEVVLKHDDK